MKKINISEDLLLTFRKENPTEEILEFKVCDELGLKIESIFYKVEDGIFGIFRRTTFLYGDIEDSNIYINVVDIETLNKFI